LPNLGALPPSTIFGFGVAGTSTAQERTRSVKEAVRALFFGTGTIGSPEAFRGEAPWSRISILVPHVVGEPASEEDRLEAARAIWRQGFQERVLVVQSLLSVSSNQDLPTPMGDGDE